MIKYLDWEVNANNEMQGRIVSDKNTIAMFFTPLSEMKKLSRLRNRISIALKRCMKCKHSRINEISIL